MLRVDLGDDSRCRPEMPGIGGQLGFARLGLGAADLLFDLPEPGFDFPPGLVVVDDLVDAEIKVRGQQRKPLALAKNPEDTHATAQILDATGVGPREPSDSPPNSHQEGRRLALRRAISRSKLRLQALPGALATSTDSHRARWPRAPRRWRRSRTEHARPE